MARGKKRRNSSDDQLGLALSGEGFSGPAQAKGLFSLAYLERHLAPAGLKASADEAGVAYNLLRQFAAGQLLALRRQNEAFTCTTLIEPVLKSLGWRVIPEQSMPKSTGTRKRPDYCLFATDDAYQQAAVSDAQTLFQLCDTVLEAKKWNHPLDQLSSKETPGWFPSQQIQDYLNKAKDAQGVRFFDWAILTNGNEWRLYCEHTAVGAYFSFHLLRDEQLCTLEEFQLFFTLFRAAAFLRADNGSCVLDHVRSQSLRVQAELENNLRKRIFGVLEDLGSAFVANEENGLTEADYGKVYEKSLIFLYRLLFILYAESRALLPVREYGPGANFRYLNDFSLVRLTSRLRQGAFYQDNAFALLYEDLLETLRIFCGSLFSRSRPPAPGRRKAS